MARSGNQDWTFCRKSARVPLPSQTNYFYHSLMQDCSPIASSRTSTGLLTSTYQRTAMYTGRGIFPNMDSWRQVYLRHHQNSATWAGRWNLVLP